MTAALSFPGADVDTSSFAEEPSGISTRQCERCLQIRDVNADLLCAECDRIIATKIALGQHRTIDERIEARQMLTLWLSRMVDHGQKALDARDFDTRHVETNNAIACGKNVAIWAARAGVR